MKYVCFLGENSDQVKGLDQFKDFEKMGLEESTQDQTKEKEGIIYVLCPKDREDLTKIKATLTSMFRDKHNPHFFQPHTLIIQTEEKIGTENVYNVTTKDINSVNTNFSFYSTTEEIITINPDKPAPQTSEVITKAINRLNEKFFKNYCIHLGKNPKQIYYRRILEKVVFDKETEAIKKQYKPEEPETVSFEAARETYLTYLQNEFMGPKPSEDPKEAFLNCLWTIIGEKEGSTLEDIQKQYLNNANELKEDTAELEKYTATINKPQETQEHTTSSHKVPETMSPEVKKQINIIEKIIEEIKEFLNEKYRQKTTLKR